MALELTSAWDAFWSWWTGELRAVLPSAPRLGASGRKSVVIGFGPDGKYSLAAPSPGGLSVEGDAKKIAEAARAARELAGATILRLPAESVFSFAVEIPERAVRRAREILSLELESATPFSADEASFDYIAEKSQVGGVRRVRQIVVKNAIVAALVEDLRRVGVEIDQVDAVGAQGINLLPMRARRKARPALRWEYGLIAASVVALLAGAHIRQGRALAALVAQKERLSAETEGVRTAAGDANAAAANIETLDKYSALHPAALSTLASLTETLDDGVWLTEVTISGRDIAITGYAASASKVINDLESSPAFAGAAFSDSVITDQASGEERFSAKLSVETNDPAAPSVKEGG